MILKKFLMDAAGVFTNYKFLVILLLNTLFFTVAAHLLPIQYEENDDIVMLFLASGMYSGIPEPHLVFINYIYGLFVTFLYNNFSGLEWYTIIFVVLHVISLSVLIWDIVRKNIKFYWKIAFIVLFYVIEVRLIILFQFTTTAALVSLAGICLICSEKWLQKLSGFLLFLIGFLIRMEASLLVLFTMTPFILIHFVQNKKIVFSKTIIFLCAVLFTAGICKYIDYCSYNNDKDWSYYYNYNKIRGSISDNPNTSSISVDKLSDNVSSVDYHLFLNTFPDPSVFNLENLLLIKEQIELIGFSQKLQNIYPSLRKYTLFLSIIAVLSFIIGVTLNKRGRCALVVLNVIFFFVLCYISLDGTLKYRVFLSTLLAYLFTLFYTLQYKKYKSSWLDGFSLLCVFSFVIIFSVRTHRIVVLRDEYRNREFVEQKLLINSCLNKTSKKIVAFRADLTVEYYHPFSVSVNGNKNRFRFLGWLTANPLNKDISSFVDLIGQYALFISKKEMDGVPVNISESIFLNHGISVHHKIEFESENYAIVTFEKK